MYYQITAQRETKPDALGQTQGTFITGIGPDAGQLAGIPATSEANAEEAARTLLNLSDFPTVRAEEIPAPPTPVIGTGRYGLEITIDGYPYQDRLYVSPKSQRAAAITYLQKGYTVKFFRLPNKPYVPAETEVPAETVAIFKGGPRLEEPETPTVVPNSDLSDYEFTALKEAVEGQGRGDLDPALFVPLTDAERAEVIAEGGDPDLVNAIVTGIAEGQEGASK